MSLNEPLQLLVTKAQQADREAFEELVECTREEPRVAIRSRLGAHLRSALDEDDLLQEVFTRVLQSIKTFRWQGRASFFAWLKAIADHLILKAARRHRAAFLAIVAISIGLYQNAERRVRRERTSRAVHAAMAEATERRAEARGTSDLVKWEAAVGAARRAKELAGTGEVGAELETRARRAC